MCLTEADTAATEADAGLRYGQSARTWEFRWIRRVSKALLSLPPDLAIYLALCLSIYLSLYIRIMNSIETYITYIHVSLSLSLSMYIYIYIHICIYIYIYIYIMNSIETN